MLRYLGSFLNRAAIGVFLRLIAFIPGISSDFANDGKNRFHRALLERVASDRLECVQETPLPSGFALYLNGLESHLLSKRYFFRVRA